MTDKSIFNGTGLILLALLLSCPSYSRADDDEFESGGTARVQGGNMERARETALKDALEAAVSLAAASLEGDKADLNSLKNHRKYIIKYTVVEEKVQKDEAVIKIRATVDLKSLRKDLVQEKEETREITLEISGLESYGQLTGILDTLGKTAGINGVSPRKFGGATALLKVDSPLQPEDLSKKISSVKVKNAQLKILKVEKNVIKVEVKR